MQPVVGQRSRPVGVGQGSGPGSPAVCAGSTARSRSLATGDRTYSWAGARGLKFDARLVYAGVF